MDQKQELFAQRLTKERTYYNGTWVSIIDLYLSDRPYFDRLVRDGVIKADEAEFVEQHSDAFRRIYATYNYSYNRRKLCNHLIMEKLGEKENTKSSDLIKQDKQSFEVRIEKNNDYKDISNKINCYVVDKKAKLCPLCHQITVYEPIHIRMIVGSKTLNARKCTRCGHYSISFPEYRRNAFYLSCLNPAVLSELTSQYENKKNKKNKNKKKNSNGNANHGSNRLLEEWRRESELSMLSPATKTIAPRVNTYCEFKLYSLNSKREIAVSIQDTEKSKRETDQWELTNRSTIGIECLKAIANDVYNIKLGDIDYIIRNIEVYDAKYIKRYKDDAYYLKHANVNNKNPHIVDCGSESVDVYVYFKLSNSCLNEKHPVESVTMRSLNRQTGKRYQVNAYYCSKCKKYFINHEAVKDLIDRNMYPAFHYVIADHYDGELKPISQLMLYGYNARADGPSAVTRHNILKWVIDSGLMSKPEIIKDLQFKIAYNGKKSGNEAAREKWEDDLDFLNTYISDNTREIKGKLRR